MTAPWWKRCYQGLRGAQLVHLFCEFSLAGFVCVELVCFVCFVLVFPVKTPAFNYLSQQHTLKATFHQVQPAEHTCRKLSTNSLFLKNL